MVIEMDLLPPRWLDIQDEVTEILSDIAAQTRKLEQLHQKHVLPGFDDDDVKKREERQIEEMTQQITRQFQNCQKAIQRIDVMVRESKQSGGISKGEETMAKNLKISLATRVGDVSSLFRKKQSAYLKSNDIYLFILRQMLTYTRTAHHWWLLYPYRSIFHSTGPEPIHRPFPHGIRVRSEFLPSNAIPNPTTAPTQSKRDSNRPARTRNRGHCAGNHRTRQYLPRATNHGHRPRQHVRQNRLQRGTNGCGYEGRGQRVDGGYRLPKEKCEEENHPSPATSCRRHDHLTWTQTEFEEELSCTHTCTSSKPTRRYPTASATDVGKAARRRSYIEHAEKRYPRLAQETEEKDMEPR